MTFFHFDHALCILFVLIQRIKVDSPNCILHVQLVLKIKWDPRGIPDNEQIIWNSIRIGWAWPHLVSRKEINIALPLPVPLLSIELLVEISRLGFSQV